MLMLLQGLSMLAFVSIGPDDDDDDNAPLKEIKRKYLVMPIRNKAG